MFRTLLKPFLLLVLTLSLGFWATDLKATHLVGGSLNYEYVGENPDGSYRYRIYSVTYTDVGATSNFDDPEDEIPIAVYENDLGDPDADKVLVTQFDLPLIAINTVTLAGLPDGCEVGNDIQIERGDYEIFIDLPLNFDGYWLYYDRCCRNDAVVNLDPQQGVGFSTYIPSALIDNSSPFFNVDPVPFLCAGDTSSFLNSAVDPDGDLMVFSFIAPYKGYSTAMNPNPGAFAYPDPLAWEVPTVNYAPTFSVAQPFGPGGYSFINGATGLTSYMAPNAGQYAVAVEIKEYRNGNLIGIIRRDLQLVVINCPPNPSPDLSNESAGNVGLTEWQIDEGDTLCFPVIFTDGNGDSLLLSSFGEVFDAGLVTPTATINTPIADLGTVEADFCWFTDCDLGRENPYFFGVTASDNGCPPKSASEVYTIEVVPFLGSTLMDGEPNPCEASVETYTTDDFPDADYTWVVSGGNLLSGQGTNEITVEWPGAGSGMITVTTTNFRGCVGDPFDLNINILPLPVIDAGVNVEICAGDSISIGGSPTGPGGSFFIWGPDQNIDDNNSSNPNVFPTTTTDYIVQVISANSCSAQDTVNVLVNSVDAIASGDTDICTGESTTITVTTTATDIIWTPGGTLSNDMIFDPSATPLDTTTYFVEVTDINGCQNEDSVTVNVLQFPTADAGMDDVICGFEYELQASPSFGAGEWVIVDPVNYSNVSDPNATATVTSEGVFVMLWTETNNGLCTSEDSLFIEFIGQPVANAGADDATCGLDYTLGASPSVGNGTWNFPPEISISDNTDPSADITASDYGTYTLDWTETNQICSDISSVTITFTEQPISDAGVDDVICGDSYNLSANASVGTGTWSGPGVLSFDDINDPNSSVTTTAFGPQSITWQEDNGNGCVAEETITITFNEIPSADAGEDISLCANEVQLDADPSIGTGTWSGPVEIGFADINTSNTLSTASTPGTYTLTWTEISNGCTDSDDVIVSYLEVPVADAGGDQDLCIGSEVNLNAQGGDSYVWSPIDGLSDPEIADPTASPSDTTTYTVTVSLGNGCSSTDQVTVNVNLLPEVSAGEDVGYLCLGDSIQLNATSGYEAYSWTPTVGLSDPNIPDPVTAPTISLEVDYIVTVTDINDCQNSDTVTVTVNPLVPTDAGPDTMICQGEPVTLGAIPVSPDGTTFAWSPTIAMNDSTLENPTVTPEITTTYTVVTNNSICSGSDEVTVIVEESPEISFEIEAVPSCTGLKVNFLNTGDSGLDYIWDLGDGTTSTDLSPSNEYTFDALYTILLTGISDMNCSYTLEEILDASEFTDYFDIVLPNVFTPNGDGENDEFNINITGEIEECFYMEIFNRWGQTVFNASGNNTRWDGYTTAGELVQPGVYFYVIEFNGASYKGSVQVIR